MDTEDLDLLIKERKEAHKEGIREVVGWIRQHLMTRRLELDATYEIFITGREWQAFLKEWEIDDHQI